MTNLTLKDLKKRADELKVEGIEFMSNHAKGDLSELLGTVFKVTDYGFIKDEDDKEYAVFITDMDDKKNTFKAKNNEGKEVDCIGYFYFGGQVLSEHLKRFEDEGFKEVIQKEGLPVLLETRKSKKTGRKYTNVILFPED